MKLNKDNYLKVLDMVDFTQAPEAIYEGHVMVLKVSNEGTDWSMYERNANIKRVVNNYFDLLGEYIESLPKEIKKKEKPVRPKPAEPKPKKDPVRKQAKQDKEPEPTSYVAHLAEDVKFIKKFVALHGKHKTPNAILNLIKALQKAIEQKLISKASSLYVKEVEDIQNKLVQVYNANHRRASIPIEIDEKLLTHMVVIAGGEQVYRSIGYLKRFIGMSGKPLDKQKAEAFIAQMQKAIDSGKIDQDDPFLFKVEGHIETLKRHLTQKKKTLTVAQTELNGLMGIVEGCGCSMNDLGELVNTHVPEVMTAKEVANMQFDLLPFTGIWQQLFGRPEIGFSMMLHGDAGAGKSTLMIKFIKFLSTLGSVIYITSEEYRSVTLTNLVNQYLAPQPDNIVFTYNTSQMNIGDFDFAVFDSGNDIGLSTEEYKRLRNENPGTAFIVLLQHTKGGLFKGAKEWEHLVQIAAKVVQGVIQVYKNRYGPKGEWNFFEN